MTEEERAATFRAEAAARLQSLNARAVLLTGSTAARERLTATWKPVTDWIAERFAPAVPTPEELQDARQRARREQVLSHPGLAGFRDDELNESDTLHG